MALLTNRLGKLCVPWFAAVVVTCGASVQAQEMKADRHEPAAREADFTRAAELRQGELRRLSDQFLGTPTPINRGSPPVGGGCQPQDNTNGLNFGAAFNVADNFNPSVSGAITAVSWSAVYISSTGTNANPPGLERFTVRFFQDNAGVPGAQLGSTITLTNPTRTNSGTTLNIGTTPAPIIWDFQSNIAGPSVTANTCYWMEIKNTSTLTSGTGTFWVAANPVPGDSVSYQGPATCAYRLIDQTSPDVTFCLSIALNDISSGTCVLASPTPPCTNPAANGNGLSVGMAGTPPGPSGIVSISEQSNYTGTGRFQAADLFRVTNGGTINQICFWGFFNPQSTGLAIDACVRDFDIIVWNVDPATLTPTTPLVPARRVGVDGVTATSGLDPLGVEQVSISLPGAAGIPVNANTCYGLTISQRLITGDNQRQAFFVWGGTANNGSAVYDNKLWVRSISTAGVAGAWQFIDLTTSTGPRNLSFLLNVGPAIAPTCVPPPVNDLCAGAVTLPLDGTPINGSDIEATPDALGGCGFQLVETSAVWYTFVGAGNDVTVTTCNAGTPSTTDTMIGVYCAATCAGPFNCVAADDDFDVLPAPCGSNAFSSQVTFPTVVGERYYVLVYHPIQKFVNNVPVLRSPGPFQISATQGAASTSPPTCDLRARCVLDAEPFDIQEVDACGVDAADTNGECATASVYTALGVTAKGTLSTGGDVRDFDFWTLPASLNGQSVSIRVRSEDPVLVQVINFTDCAAGTGTVVDGFVLVACLDLAFEVVTVDLPATGLNAILLAAPSFDGQPCVGANAFNDYRLRVVQPAVGACCLLSTACFVTTFADCDAQSTGDPNDFWAEAVTCAVSPCDSQPGRCCLPDGTCQFVPSAAIGNAAACAAASGTYTAGGTCAPNTCPAVANIACCRGSSCSVEPAAGCTGPNTFNSGAAACNIAGNYTTPCCKADYNHSGSITVQDIFDFLAAYFTVNPNADINASGGVTVQDIFDFLSAYFLAGCP